uniref:Secreted frizzled-related protein 2 n=1 Tax=Schistocephalus solidus TaxID=70667 RepID=A0A0X3NSD6_SCHSO
MMLTKLPTIISVLLGGLALMDDAGLMTKGASTSSHTWDPRYTQNGLGHGSLENLTETGSTGPGGPSYFSDLVHLMNGYSSHECHEIPKKMKLCTGLGYNMMVLPNSLEHARVEEVIAQSEVWLTLVNIGCHEELRLFLCSLYAPICIADHKDKLIQPCRDLCESVRGACLPIMSNFGLRWPDMVTCSKFPTGQNEVCIPSKKQTKQRCFGCVENPTYESAIGSYCNFDTVVRVKVQELRSIPNGRNDSYTLQGKVRPFPNKLPPLDVPASKLQYRVDCDCPIIKAAAMQRNGAGRWLVMGNLSADGNVVKVQHLSQIREKNTGIKKAIEDIWSKAKRLCHVDLMNPLNNHFNIHRRSPVDAIQRNHNQEQANAKRRRRRGRNRNNRNRVRRRGERRRGITQETSTQKAEGDQSKGNMEPSIKPTTISQIRPLNDFPVRKNEGPWDKRKDGFLYQPSHSDKSQQSSLYRSWTPGTQT